MITEFSEVILVRRNGKQRKLEYKIMRKLTDELLYSICSKLGIPSPFWNKASNQFEFDDTFWEGSEGMTPEYLYFLDQQGFHIEKVYSEYEEEEEEEITQ